MDKIVAKSPARMIVAAAQRTGHISGSLLSAYWCAVEDKNSSAGSFLAQALTELREVEKLIREIDERIVPHEGEAA